MKIDAKTHKNPVLNNNCLDIFSEVTLRTTTKKRMPIMKNIFICQAKMFSSHNVLREKDKKKQNKLLMIYV